MNNGFENVFLVGLSHFQHMYTKTSPKKGFAQQSRIGKSSFDIDGRWSMVDGRWSMVDGGTIVDKKRNQQ
jgi:hypothetical protein